MLSRKASARQCRSLAGRWVLQQTGSAHHLATKERRTGGFLRLCRCRIRVPYVRRVLADSMECRREQGANVRLM